MAWIHFLLLCILPDVSLSGDVAPMGGVRCGGEEVQGCSSCSSCDTDCFTWHQQWWTSRPCLPTTMLGLPLHYSITSGGSPEAQRRMRNTPGVYSLHSGTPGSPVYVQSRDEHLKAVSSHQNFLYMSEGWWRVSLSPGSSHAWIQAPAVGTLVNGLDNTQSLLTLIKTGSSNYMEMLEVLSNLTLPTNKSSENSFLNDMFSPPTSGWLYHDGNKWVEDSTLAVVPKGVDCAWGDWEASKCSKAIGGEKTFKREVVVNHTKYGNPCEGEPIKTEPCDRPADCELSEWEVVTACASLCDGQQDFSRRVVAAARGGGKSCWSQFQNNCRYPWYRTEEQICLDEVDTKQEFCNRVECSCLHWRRKCDGFEKYNHWMDKRACVLWESHCSLCEEDWYHFGTSCYRPYRRPMSWTDARAACRASGGDLASITSEEENTFVSRLLPNSLLWIGGHFNNQTGDWRWSDNSTWSNVSTAAALHKQAGGLALALDFRGSWRAMNSGSKDKLWYVCKVTEAPQNTSSVGTESEKIESPEKTEHDSVRGMSNPHPTNLEKAAKVGGLVAVILLTVIVMVVFVIVAWRKGRLRRWRGGVSMVRLQNTEEE